MEAFSVIGFLGAIAAILVGQHLEGGQWETLLNLPAFLIVVGGTLGAVMIETPRDSFKQAFTMVKWVFFPPKKSSANAISAIIHWSQMTRKEGFLGLENISYAQKDPFIRRGLQLIIDGHDGEMLREILTLEIENKEIQDIKAANVFQSMGGYSPTIGILGAVLGLIQVLGNLSEPEKLGAGIAVAFVATIYGVGFANIFFLPISKKLKSIVQEESQYKELLLEGFVGIAQGENPRFIEAKCQSFVTSK